MILANNLAGAVSPERLWADWRELTQLGKSTQNPVYSLPPEAADLRARLWLVRQARTLNVTSYLDAVGNLFLRLEGTDPQAETVVTGNHIDPPSTSAGIDPEGAYGVLAGLSVLRAMRTTGIQNRRPIEVAVWTRRHGASLDPEDCDPITRFSPALRIHPQLLPTGLRASAHPYSSALRGEGVHTRRAAVPIHEFVELHIQQGLLPNPAECPIGLVEGLHGVARFEIQIQGFASHAVTTPRAVRADALEAACELARVLRHRAYDADDLTQFAIGNWHTGPNRPDRIPDSVTFTIDLRHPDAQVLDQLEHAFQELLQERWAGCTARLKPLTRIHPVNFPEKLVNRIRSTLQTLGLPCMRLDSGTFHDAMHLTTHCCPTALLCIACAQDLHAHPAEETITPQQATEGARALAAVMLDLANT
jgi:N-carbamoyl-L-amino-acid hydrolase